MIKIIFCVLAGILALILTMFVLDYFNLDEWTNGYICGFIVTISNTFVIGYIDHRKKRKVCCE